MSEDISEVEIRRLARRSVVRVLRHQANHGLPDFEHLNLTLAERIVLAGELRIIADLIDVEP